MLVHVMITIRISLIPVLPLHLLSRDCSCPVSHAAFSRSDMYPVTYIRLSGILSGSRVILFSVLYIGCMCFMPVFSVIALLPLIAYLCCFLLSRPSAFLSGSSSSSGSHPSDLHQYSALPPLSSAPSAFPRSGRAVL